MSAAELLPQYAFADQIAAALSQDSRVRAVWLEGSLGREQGDRHSDVDLHIALNAEDLIEFRANYEAFLNRIQPVLKHHKMFGAMDGSILTDPHGRLNLLQTWFDSKAELKISKGRTRVLFDRDSHLEHIAPIAPTSEELSRALHVEICYFWSLLAELPSIERGELLAASHRLYLQVDQITFVHALGRGRLRDVGDWRLNELLETHERQQLEQVMSLPDFSMASVVSAHMNLAQIMRVAGRQACVYQNATYPEVLEKAVLKHVSKELQRMGFSVETLQNTMFPEKLEVIL